VAFDPCRFVGIRVPGSKSFGSGYLLTDRLVVTAAHVVRPLADHDDVAAVEVRFITPDGRLLPVRAVQVYLAREADVALVELPEGASMVTGCSWLGAPPLGRVGGSSPIAGQAIGFPRSQAYEGRRDVEQVIGHIAPVSTIRSGLLTLHVHGSTPLPDPAGGSGWQGMSGSALFAGPYLVGVLVTDPVRFGGTRLEATPITELIEDATLVNLLPAEAAAEQVQLVSAEFNYDLGGGVTIQLRPPYQSLPPGLHLPKQPSVLLQARFALVPFLSRDGPLDDLANWCATTQLLGVRLVTGPGGAGKSRLVSELCIRMLKQGWQAGLSIRQRLDRR
jgi:Trypsin-like peptidase domain